jgi:hypothetical protein
MGVANTCDKDRYPYRKKNDYSFCHATMPYDRALAVVARDF